MKDIFEKMSSWAAGRGRLCLAMCYFGHDDLEHGCNMCTQLMSIEDAEEKVKLTLYVCGNVSVAMAQAMFGMWRP